MISIAQADAMLANLADDETRCELSDLAVNTLREDFGADASDLAAGEFSRIRREGITTMIGYLRCRRPGSPFRMNRGQRVAVWCHWASFTARPTWRRSA